MSRLSTSTDETLITIASAACYAKSCLFKFFAIRWIWLGSFHSLARSLGVCKPRWNVHRFERARALGGKRVLSFFRSRKVHHFKIQTNRKLFENISRGGECKRRMRLIVNGDKNTKFRKVKRRKYITDFHSLPCFFPIRRCAFDV